MKRPLMYGSLFWAMGFAVAGGWIANAASPSPCPAGKVWSESLKTCVIPVNSRAGGTWPSAPVPQVNKANMIQEGPLTGQSPRVLKTPGQAFGCVSDCSTQCSLRLNQLIAEYVSSSGKKCTPKVGVNISNLCQSFGAKSGGMTHDEMNLMWKNLVAGGGKFGMVANPSQFSNTYVHCPDPRKY